MTVTSDTAMLSVGAESAVARLSLGTYPSSSFGESNNIRRPIMMYFCGNVLMAPDTQRSTELADTYETTITNTKQLLKYNNLLKHL